MSIKTTHYVQRDEAIAILNDKRANRNKSPKSYANRTNYWLGNKLDDKVNNIFYNFLVADEVDDTKWNTINRYNVPDELED